MFQLAETYDEVKKVVGQCSDEVFLRTATDAFAMIASQMEPEGLRGYLDICSVGCACASGGTCPSTGCGKQCVSLPREVETILGVNCCGSPGLGYGSLFSFHLNGPGDGRTSCKFSWEDRGGFHSTFKDLITPSNLVVYVNTEDDNGKKFVVFGYDSDGNLLQHTVGGEVRKGILIPTIYGYAIPDEGQPRVARITGIFKERSNSMMRLSTTDGSGALGILLGIYEPDETVPQYRRIRLSRPCDWMTIAYKKINPTFHSIYDHVPLKSRMAFLMAVIARKFYREFDFANAHSCEADAVRMELNAQMAADPPTYSPPMILGLNDLKDQDDYHIV